MVKRYLALGTLGVLLVAMLLTSFPASIQAQDARTVLNAVVTAMGAGNLRTLQITGAGSNAGIGQNVNPYTGWPVVRVKSYTRQLDFDAGASHVQMVRINNNADQAQEQIIPANAPWAQQFDYWVTPYAFLKGAAANAATARPETLNGAKYTALTFTLQNKYKVEGWINDKNMVERVRTWVDNDVLGDMLVEGVYTDYKDYGGVKVPSLMIVKQGGFPTLILAVTDAKPNVAVSMAPTQAPAAAAAAAAPVTTVVSEKVADGVYYITGSTHHSVAVEFADHVVLIEAPLTEDRVLAVLAEVKKDIPNKPITFLVNTHAHFDHAGGLRTIVDAGIPIVTADINKNFYEKIFADARTLNPDRLQQSKKKPTIITTGDKYVMTDATRTLELHLAKGNPHNEGILVGYLPKEKILIEVDMFNPPAAGAALPAAGTQANLNAAALVTEMEALRLDFDTILGLHGQPTGKVQRPALYAFINKPVTDLSKLPPLVAAGAGGRGGAAAAGVEVAADPKDVQIVGVLNTACTACHNLQRVGTKQVAKADAAPWLETVTRMKGKGAAITDDQIPTLIEYLARTKGQ